MSLDLGIFAYPFMYKALVAGVLVAVLAGLLGVFLVLRQMSLLGDGLAHVSFAGVAVGLAAGLYPPAFALLFAIVGAIAIYVLRERRIVKGDTAIGLLLTGGLATGLMVISRGQGFGASMNNYLFGQILAIEDRDLYVVVGVGVVLVVLLIAFYKEFFSMTFSEETSKVTGLPVAMLNVVFMALTAATIVVASRVVGVLLVSALLIAPAATALQWARGFRIALLLSVLLGVTSVVVGLLLALQGFAAGASIAATSIAFFLVTLAVKNLRKGPQPHPPQT